MYADCVCSVGIRAKTLIFANGIDEITTDEENANEKADSLNEHNIYIRKDGMKINSDQTKVMITGGTRKLGVDLDVKKLSFLLLDVLNHDI